MNQTQAALCAERVGFGYGSEAPVLSDVTLSVAPGASVGLVGESGAGKTTLLRLLLGLATPTVGRITFAGQPLDVRDGAAMRAFRRSVQPVFQDPFSSLDPRMSVGRSIAEPLRSLRIDGDPRARVSELLEAVGLPADAAERYPDAFSGGQRQRIAIARGLVIEPDVVIADEITSALDVSVQAQILDLLAEIKEKLGITMLFISHNLAVVQRVSDEVVVLYQGRVVESGPVEQIYADPQHWYTRRLLDADPGSPGFALVS